MPNQLLASFYVQSNYSLTNSSVTRTITAQSSGAANNDLTTTLDELGTVTINGDTLYRAKINVYRVEVTAFGVTYYRLFSAGAHKYQLLVSAHGITLGEKLLHITIQPDVRVFRNIGSAEVDMVHTVNDGLAVSSNPLNQPRKVELVDTTSNTPEAQAALAARTILMDETEGYSQEVFITSNSNIDAYCADFTSAAGLWVKNKINITRSIFSLGNNPTIITDQQTQEKYVNLIHQSGIASSQNLLLNQIACTFGKRLIDIPLHVQSNLSLVFLPTNKYTSNGDLTTPVVPSPPLPFSLVLETPPIFKLMPSVTTLDEDNSYKSFITVETNDDAIWSLDPVTPSGQLKLTPTSGTGRAAIVVEKLDDIEDSGTFDWDSEDFHAFEVKGKLTVGLNPPTDSASVHVERYDPTRNALIPRQITPSPSMQLFDNSLTNEGLVGAWAGTSVTGSTPFNGSNLSSFPTAEFVFGNNEAHRIRSWSLQSVGESSGQRAQRLILSGKTLDGKWIILDDTGESLTTGTGNFYSTTKLRVDRLVKHKALVEAIRITAVRVTSASNLNPVRFPQIQVFAGEPVMEKMNSTPQTANGKTYSVRANSGDNGIRVFDKEVNGAQLAIVGVRGWYDHWDMFLQNNVASNGVLGGYQETSSNGWLELMLPPANDTNLPPTKLLGYLYSIDDVVGGVGNVANTAYAASLLFEGGTANWAFIRMISLDNCLGNNDFGDTTAALIGELGQTELNTYAQHIAQMLGLPVPLNDKTFLRNTNDNHIVRYDALTGQWNDEGIKINPANDAIDQVHNRTHYTDLLDTMGNPRSLDRIRFSVQSIMNTEKPAVPGHPVSMPEMQFFELPTKKINVGNVTSVALLKAEDANGTLHDILGKDMTLPHQRLDTSASVFRLHIGAVTNVAISGIHERRLYLSVRNANGSEAVVNGQIAAANLPTNSNMEFTPILVTNLQSNPRYFEVYIYDPDGNKIILSSGYTGIPPGGGTNSQMAPEWNEQEENEE